MGNIAFRMEIAAVLAVAAVMTACEKGGETVENGSPECEAFLAAATEYGLYSDGVPVRVFCRTEDQLVRDSEGTTLASRIRSRAACWRAPSLPVHRAA